MLPGVQQKWVCRPSILRGSRWGVTWYIIPKEFVTSIKRPFPRAQKRLLSSFNQKVCLKSLVIREGHNLALLIDGVEHGHCEVHGLHGHVGGSPIHEVVNALGQRVVGIRVVVVSEGGKPRVRRGIGVLVDQCICHQ